MIIHTETGTHDINPDDVQSLGKYRGVSVINYTIIKDGICQEIGEILYDNVEDLALELKLVYAGL